MPNCEVDVAIIGAGPAGAVAAHTLAQQGLRTVILDKARLPRYKTCGGGVVARVASMLPVDLAPAVERECHLAEFTDRRGDLRLEVRRPTPLVYMTMREQFDWLLVQAACDRGASLMHPCELRDLSQTPDEVTLSTTEGTIRARYVIAADGATGVVARKAGWAAGPPTIPALEWEIEVPATDLDRFGSARFDLGFPDRGYSWVFPKRNHLSVGLLTQHRGGVPLKQRLGEYLDGLGLPTNGNARRHGFVIPIRPRPGGASRGRVLLVGDAAGLADPITCEGITHAVHSGRLAALAVIQGGLERAQRVRSLYRGSLAREVLAELRVARLLAPIVYRRARLRRWLLGWFGQVFAEGMAEVIGGAQTYRRLLLGPANYLKLLHFGLRSVNGRV